MNKTIDWLVLTAASRAQADGYATQLKSRSSATPVGEERPVACHAAVGLM